MSLESRTALYARLTEVLGDHPAATLMAYLPDDRAASAAEVHDLGVALGLRADGTEARLDGVDHRLGRVESRLDAVESRLDAVEHRLVQFEARLDGVDTRLDALESRMARLEDRLTRIEERMGDLVDRFHGELRHQTRTFVLASLGSSATMAAAIVTAAALL